MEKEGYRETLAMLMEMYPGRAARPPHSASEPSDPNIGTIYDATKRVKNPLPSKKLSGKLIIPIPALARWMC